MLCSSDNAHRSLHPKCFFFHMRYFIDCGGLRWRFLGAIILFTTSYLILILLAYGFSSPAHGPRHSHDMTSSLHSSHSHLSGLEPCQASSFPMSFAWYFPHSSTLRSIFLSATPMPLDTRRSIFPIKLSKNILSPSTLENTVLVTFYSLAQTTMTKET